MRAALSDILGGRWTFTDVLDSCGPHRQCCSFALRCTTDPTILANGGALRPVTVIAPPGWLRGGHATGGRGRQQRGGQPAGADVCLGPGRRPSRPLAAGQTRTPVSSMVTVVTLGCTTRRSSATRTAGRSGPERAGMSGVHDGMTNTLNTPTEALERAFPLRSGGTQLRRGSGGAGEHPGSEGIECDLDDCTVSLVTERRQSRPWGLGGGEAGAPGENWLLPRGDESRAERLAAKCTLRLHAGRHVTDADAGMRGMEFTAVTSCSRRAALRRSQDEMSHRAPTIRSRPCKGVVASSPFGVYDHVREFEEFTVPSNSMSVAGSSDVQVERSIDIPDAVVTVEPMLSQVIAEIDDRRRQCGDELDPTRRSELGQYFTPAAVAAFMADQLEVQAHPVRLLDPGAGVGSLTGAVVARWCAHGGGPIAVTAVETDPALQVPLGRTLDELGSVHDLSRTVVTADFVEWGTDRVSGFGILDAPKFDLVVMNPPYRKIHTASPERRRLSAVGIEVPNLYAGFVALAVRLLDDGGQLVAITPRSFTNGPYFRSFRRQLLHTVGLKRIHVFDARDLAFADSEVLQENVIFCGVRGHEPRSLVVSSSKSVTHAVTTRTVPYAEVVRPDDPESFVRITVDKEAVEYARQVGELPCRLPDLELEVCTGPVVDFRSRTHLRADPDPGTVPIVFPHHLRDGRVLWPQLGGRKPNGLMRCEETARLLMPSGTYVLVKRFSAKEERRRIVAVVASPDDLPGDAYTFENHLNVFHKRGGGLPPDLARGLAAFLNTTTVDQFFRQFNGHTQVNATDLRSLRYPSFEELIALGQSTPEDADQDTLDAVAAGIVTAFADPVAARSA